MKRFKKFWLSFALFFLFYLPIKSKSESKRIIDRINLVRESIKSKDASALKINVLEIRHDQLNKDWANWGNWSNWSNWSNWNNWAKWNDWNNWGNWGNWGNY